MTIPEYWREYELKRVAARMRRGEFGIPQPKLSDVEKVQVALLLLARHDPSEHFAVWMDAGRLSIRYGLQGSPVRLAWRDAIALVQYFRRVPFRKTVASFAARPKRRSA